MPWREWAGLRKRGDTATPASWVQGEEQTRSFLGFVLIIMLPGLSSLFMGIQIMLQLQRNPHCILGGSPRGQPGREGLAMWSWEAEGVESVYAEVSTS